MRINLYNSEGIYKIIRVISRNPRSPLQRPDDEKTECFNENDHGKKMDKKRPYYPACVIAFLIVLAFGIFTVCQVYLLKDNYPVSKLWVGSDYICIYNATQNLIQGVSLYENTWLFMPDYLKQLAVALNLYQIDNASWYCYPPLLAYLNYPLVYFDMDTASRLMFFLLIISIFSAYALINSSYESIGGKDRKIIFLCGVIIIVLSSPFYFLILRGHMVGVVFLLLAMGIYLFKKDNLLCSVCFALSIGAIVFPALLFVPLLLFRRYKVFLLTLLSLAILILIDLGGWLEFIQGPILDRIDRPLVGPDNCSLANTCRYFMLILNKSSSFMGLSRIPILYVKEIALTVYLILLCVMAFADFKIRKKSSCFDKEVEISLLMMYCPFMIAIPQNSYQYNLVIVILLIPALCSLTQKFKRPMPKIVLWALMTGIFLSQMQARFIQNLINLKPDFFYFFQAFGLFLIMIGCVLFKFWFWRVGSRGILRSDI